MNEKLQKELRKKIITNPFNDNFSEDALKELVAMMDAGNLLIVDVYREYNRYFKDYYGELKNLLVHTGYSKKGLITTLLSYVNHGYLCLVQELAETQPGGDFSKMFSAKTKSISLGFNDIDMSAAAESMVDAAASLINFILKFEFKQICDDQELEKSVHLDNIQSMLISSNYFDVVKDAYETPVWRNAFYAERDGSLFLQFKDEVDLRSFEIARYRMQQNLFARLQLNKRLFGLGLKEPGNGGVPLKRQLPVGIKQIRSIEGFIKVILEQEGNAALPEDYLHFISALELYYPFLGNMVLPAYGQLQLFDVLYMYSLFQELVDTVKRTYRTEDILSRQTLSHIVDKITVDELEYYYLKRTTYNLSEINAFLKLLQGSLSERINFWDTPLYRHDYYFQVLFLPLLAPVPYHMIDTMLEKSGIDLKFRGEAFERYVKRELNTLLSNLHYTYFICPQRVVDVKKGKGKVAEEIDLMLFLGEIILIAEVKCLKYPMENRDKHNVEKTLLGAAEQIIRKQAFVENNYDAIAEKFGIKGDRKEIIPIIITNYPTATGTRPLGIPVLDFSLLKLYFETNEIVVKYVTASEEELSEVIIDKQILYTNEQEFSAHLRNYCYDNPIIMSYLSMTEMSFNRVTMEGHFEKDLFKQSCTANIFARPFTTE